MNDIFSLPLEVPNTDDDPPPTSYGYPYNPYIEGVEEKIVVSPLYYLYDHLDERMFSTGVAIDRSVNERTAKADGWLWEYKLQELDGEPLIEDAVEPRFKSTQHERDQLSGFDFRGARYYDSEFGMFLSVDPLASDFTAWSPYNYVMGNPMRLIDPDGRAPIEPNLSQATSVSDFVNYLSQNKLNTLSQIYTHFKNNSTSVPRYIYTESNGWMDMNHVIGTMENGLIAMNALEPLSGNKKARNLLFGGNGENSYFSYEDLPSNKFGAEVAMALGENNFTGGDLSLSEVIANKLNEAGAIDPRLAPNYNQIPASSDRKVIKDKNGNVQKLTTEQLETGMYVPQNFTTEPYNLNDFPAAPDSNDKSNNK